MATVDKNFRIKNGLVVEGTTGTINGNNILTESAGDSYILNLVGGSTLVKSVDTTTFTVDGSGNLTVNSGVFDAYGAASSAQTAAQSYADGLAPNYDAAGAASAAQTAAQSYADSLAGNYDAAGAAATAQSNAESYADAVAQDLSDHEALSSGVHGVTGSVVGTTDTQDLSNKRFIDTTYFTDGVTISNEGQIAVISPSHEFEVKANVGPLGLKSYNDDIVLTPGSGKDVKWGADVLATQSYADGAAGTAQSNAESYADTAASNALSSANTYTDGAITNLVDGAPTLLDTLKELAQAIDNDASYASTLTTALGGKQDNLTASTGITIDGSNNISVTTNTYDTYGSASTAESNAKSYADGLASNYDPAGAASTAQSNAEGYADDIVGNVLSGDTAFTAVNVNSVAGIWAAISTVVSPSTITAWSYNSTVFTSAKLLVSIKANGHSQVSEVLVTLDSAGNVAITEFGIVGTNGSLGEVTAVNSSGNINIRVTTAYSNSDVIVHATTLL